MEVYLDNSATTKVRSEVLPEIIDVYENCYGNPSSLHRKGLEIEKRLDIARKNVSKVINVKPEEIYFTSGGTESNNIAVYGHVANRGNGGNIVTTKIEHPSVYNIFKHFEKNNIDVRYVSTDSLGVINIDELNCLVDDHTLLVSFILVNNELGTIQNLSEIVKIIRKKNLKVKIHVDAIQAFGKINIDLSKIPVDTMSFSSHKVNGPKGVGGLYIDKRCRLESLIFGGNQEKGVRPGTENTPGIVGFGKACELLNVNFSGEMQKLREIKNQYSIKLCQAIEDVNINSPLDENGAPHILNVSFKNVRGEVLVHYLERYGIYVSTGSACSSKVKSNNRILEAVNLDKAYIDGTIRLSFGYFNNLDEVDYVVEKMKQSVDEIRSIMK